MNEELMIGLSAVLVLGVGAQWFAWRLNLPSILLLLAFGFLARLAGSPDDMIGQEILFPIVSLSVAVILFEGGMSLKLSELREAGSAVLRLITIGAFVTWVLATLAAWYIMQFSLPLAALAGAILVVTGPTVIAPLLNHIRPAKKIGAIAKWEGIVIDPIGAVLAVLIFEVVLASSGEATSEAFWVVTRTIFFGITLGVASAWTLVLLLKRFWIPDFLHNTFFLAVILVIFAVSNHLQRESGLLTVTARALPAAALNRHVTDELTIADGARIVFSFGVEEDGWVEGWPSVAFRVFARTGEGEERLLFDRRIDPAGDARDRRWFEAALDVGALGVAHGRFGPARQDSSLDQG